MFPRTKQSHNIFTYICIYTWLYTEPANVLSLFPNIVNVINLFHVSGLFHHYPTEVQSHSPC